MKFITRFALVIALLAVTVGVASAAFNGPYYDVYVNVGGTVQPSQIVLYVQDSTPTCTDTQVTYFQFDASNIKTVSTASLELTVGGTKISVSDGAALTQLSIYGVNDFVQGSLTGTNAPLTTGLTPIQTLALPANLAQYDKVSFSGSNLADYIQSQTPTGLNGVPGDGTVTLALSFSANCGAQNSQLNFYSQEYTTDTTRQPQLVVTGTKPNSVEVSQASAQRTAWPLYAGLGTIALFVVAGVVISRRRTA
jgi:hypothetical protein